jgi:uncharacterized protein (DUF433 family)
MTLLDRIRESAPNVLEYPRVRDTGVPVVTVLKMLAAAQSPAEVVMAQPGLEEDDVRACLEFLRHIVLPPGNPTRAAVRLRISRRTLVEMTDHLGIPRPRYHDPTREPSTRTKEHIAALFAPSEHPFAVHLLVCLSPVSSPRDLERVHFAALRVSDGDLEKLADVVQLDWRDILMAAGFAHDVHAHETWVPRRSGRRADVAG